MTMAARAFVLVWAISLCLAPPAGADVLSEMESFWRGAAVNTTGPTAFDGQASGHWTLGNLYLRAPVRSEPIATVSLPSFRAGCGGIEHVRRRLLLHRFRPAESPLAAPWPRTPRASPSSWRWRPSRP